MQNFKGLILSHVAALFHTTNSFLRRSWHLANYLPTPNKDFCLPTPHFIIDVTADKIGQNIPSETNRLPLLVKIMNMLLSTAFYFNLLLNFMIL